MSAKLLDSHARESKLKIMLDVLTLRNDKYKYWHLKDFNNLVTYLERDSFMVSKTGALRAIRSREKTKAGKKEKLLTTTRVLLLNFLFTQKKK